MRPIKITHVPHLNGNPTPARCNRRTGEIWINDSVMRHIKPEHRMFILLHELGHIELQSSDEMAVDRWAMDQYIKLGYALTDSVTSLSRVLTGKTNSHVDRVKAQLDRAKEIDHKNKKAMCKSSLTNNCNCSGCNQSNFAGDPVPWYNRTPEFADSFDGCDPSKLSPRKYRKCVKAVGKATKKVNLSEGRKALQEGKGSAAAVKAEAKRILADQGIVDSSALGDAVRTAGNMLKGSPEVQSETSTGSRKSSSAGKVMMWIGIGIGSLALIGTIIYLIKRK